MFHYSIVFPYMHRLGFTTSQLVIYALVTNVVVFLVEIPSGIIADRWSRKGVLLLSLLFMAVGCLLLGSAHSYGGFMVATAVTGLYFGMSSGVQEAMLYDVLLEHDRRKDYERLLGRLRIVYTTGLVTSSLTGALLASRYTFHLPFYFSAVSCLIGFAVLLFFAEPRLHREVESARIGEHIMGMFRLLARHPETRLLVVNNILIGIIFCFMLDVDPLWPIALGLATIWFGPLNALFAVESRLCGYACR